MRYSKLLIIKVLYLFSLGGFAQNTQTIQTFSDTTQINLKKLPYYRRDKRSSLYSERRSQSPFLLKNPSSYKQVTELDTSGKFFNISEKIGDTEIQAPSRMTFEEYKKYRFREDQNKYFKKKGFEPERGAIQDTSSKRPTTDKLIPDIYLGPVFNRLFGGDKVDIRTTGSVVLDFGFKFQRVDNPTLPIRLQRNGGFDFDQQIQMNMTGKIGSKFSTSVRYDTKAGFQFDNQMNFAYKAFEEDILQEVQFGNINFTTSNSLIKGSQNLFGIKTKLRFGRLFVNTVLANQRGTGESITIRNGATGKEIEIRCNDYDDNRHFFLAHFFREIYERSLTNLPMITSGVQVTRVEVYVTNIQNIVDKQRNVVALMDLGESNPSRSSFAKPNQPAFQILQGDTVSFPADNNANLQWNLFSNNINVRNGNVAISALEAQGLINGADFEYIQRARRLSDNEFTFHPQLGYISLKQRLNINEALAVAFEYTYNGQRYRVGELTDDYQNRTDAENIILKLLKPASIRFDLKNWDLMMKNIYSLGTVTLRRENFRLNIIYRDDDTGIDNPTLQETSLAGRQLVEILKMDQLNPNNDRGPDGLFDYLPNITIDENNGRVIFPVLEPFGNTLKKQMKEDVDAQFFPKYIFDLLYRKNKYDNDVQQNTLLAKFFLRIQYQTGSGSEIKLPALNIAPRSVQITAGGIPLTEGTDFNVDYMTGTIRILNDAVMASGKDITIRYERADMFSFQTRNLMGTDIEYHFNKNFKLTSTLLYLNERPIIRRVTVGTEPTSNALWGVGMDWRGESQLVTRIIDQLPGISTKTPSKLTTKLEFAQILPGSPALLGKNGTAYIDDFEAAEIPINIGSQPLEWKLGAVPRMFASNSDTGLSLNFRRAKLAWYTIDNVFYFTGGGTARSRPPNLTDEDVRNQYVRLIPFNEIYPARQRGQVLTNEPTFDLAYFPNERGFYNYNPNLNPDGTLPNPRQNFAAITRGIVKNNQDFDALNVQYIEFWLMDPFLTSGNSEIIYKRYGQEVRVRNTTGGDLYFNLGLISEDAIPDRRDFFEQLLPLGTINTSYGTAPTATFVNDAFDASRPRELQDVGLDGINSDVERSRFGGFLSQIQSVVNPNVYAQIAADPANDDFRYYLGASQDLENNKILDRYRFYNGTENNSPPTTGGAAFPSSNSNFPDKEDLNANNKTDLVDQYYQIRVPITPQTMDVGKNPYITNKVEATNPENGEPVTWYQFRVPIRGDNVENIGNIAGYKSINQIRLFLTNWEQPVILRFAQFQLVGAQWRPYEFKLSSAGENLPLEPSSSLPKINTVNLEENGQALPNRTPYVLPPGIFRDFDATSQVTRQLNEQSLQLCIQQLPAGEAVAAYKNLVLDLIQYGRIQMEIHAESDDKVSQDGDLTAFLRLGTDANNNYYEIEVPLKLTPIPSFSPFEIWPENNRIDIAIQDLISIKTRKYNSGLELSRPYAETLGRYRITVVGRPDISAVQTILIGIRNPKKTDAGSTNFSRNLCIWVNELRVTEFNNIKGWAINTNLGMNLADLATLQTNLRYSTFGFGSLQDKPQQRQRTNNLDFDITTNVQLDKFFLNKIGISLPMFWSYERSVKRPKFDPLDPDVLVENGVGPFTQVGQSRPDNYPLLVSDIQERRSINFSNIKKKKISKEAKSYPWDIENWTFSYSYSEQFRRDIRTESYALRQWKTSAAYAFSPQVKPFEPFSKSKSDFMKKNSMKWLKDINLNPIPNSFTMRGEIDRRLARTQLRDSRLSTQGIRPIFEKSFFVNRTYTLNWQLTKSISLDYNATARGIIDEPFADITQRQNDSLWRAAVTGGRPKSYSHSIGANYRLPFDKIPGLDFLSADARYQGGYDWTANALSLQDSFGNHINNKQNVTLNGRIDLNKIYDKVPYLKRINEKAKQRARSRDGKIKIEDPLEWKRKRLEERLQPLEKRVEKQQARRNQRIERRTAKMNRRYERALQKDALFEENLRKTAQKTQQRFEEEKKNDSLKIAQITPILMKRDSTGELANNFRLSVENDAKARIKAREDERKEDLKTEEKRQKELEIKRQKIAQKQNVRKLKKFTYKAEKQNFQANRWLRKRRAERDGIYEEPTIARPMRPNLDTGQTRLQRKQARLQAKLNSIKEKIEYNKKNDIQPPENRFVEGVFNGLMSFKDFNVSYSQNATTDFPGASYTPDWLGFDPQWNAPGIPFMLGDQSQDIKERGAQQNWLAKSSQLNNPFRQTMNRQITFRTQAEPIRDFKISFDARMNNQSSYNEVFRWNDSAQAFLSQSPVRTGSYGTSFIAIRTSFKQGEATNSTTFQAFVSNRHILTKRLNDENPFFNSNDTARQYLPNSQDVLIPSFLAAYAGTSPHRIRLSNFPSIPLPNWKITYTGLSRLEFFKKSFQSINLNHSYQSDYNVGSYASSLGVATSQNIALSISEQDIGRAQLDPIRGNLTPLLVINQVSIRENFSPLLGINMRTKSNVSIKIDYNRRRDIALNLSNAQINENHTNDIMIDIGYTKAGMKLPFLRTPDGKTVVLQNDVTFRCAFTIRENKTILHRIVQDEKRRENTFGQITQGNEQLQLRPTISYTINKKANMQIYFERTINNPLVSNSFRRTNTSFGIQFRFNLTQ